MMEGRLLPAPQGAGVVQPADEQPGTGQGLVLPHLVGDVDDLPEQALPVGGREHDHVAGCHPVARAGAEREPPPVA